MSAVGEFTLVISVWDELTNADLLDPVVDSVAISDRALLISKVVSVVSVVSTDFSGTTSSKKESVATVYPTEVVTSEIMSPLIVKSAGLNELTREVSIDKDSSV